MSDLHTLKDLFVDELQHVYDAEKQILKALPEVIKAVTNGQSGREETTAGLSNPQAVESCG
jgi:ferritin-like metal-binding protein YciE